MSTNRFRQPSINGEVQTPSPEELELLKAYAYMPETDKLIKAIELDKVAPNKTSALINSLDWNKIDRNQRLLALREAARIGCVDILAYLIDHRVELGIDLNGHYVAPIPRIKLADHPHLDRASLHALLTPVPLDSALTEAAKEGHLDCVKLLIDNGADVNHRLSTADYTPLVAAAGYNPLLSTAATIKKHEDVVNYLLSHGADCNSIVSYDSYAALTPLKLAVQNHLPNAVTLLLAGATTDEFVMSRLAAKASDPYAQLCLGIIMERNIIRAKDQLEQLLIESKRLYDMSTLTHQQSQAPGLPSEEAAKQQEISKAQWSASQQRFEYVASCYVTALTHYQNASLAGLPEATHRYRDLREHCPIPTSVLARRGVTAPMEDPIPSVTNENRLFAASAESRGQKH